MMTQSMNICFYLPTLKANMYPVSAEKGGLIVDNVPLAGWIAASFALLEPFAGVADSALSFPGP